MIHFALIFHKFRFDSKNAFDRIILIENERLAKWFRAISIEQHSHM